MPQVGAELALSPSGHPEGDGANSCLHLAISVAVSVAHPLGGGLALLGLEGLSHLRLGAQCTVPLQREHLGVAFSFLVRFDNT